MSTDLKRFLKLQTALINEKACIESRLAQISKVLGDSASTPTPTTTTPAPASTPAKSGKRTFSEATKAKMRVSQQARWARLKGKAVAVAPAAKAAVVPKKKRNKMSAQGLANIVAAQKARWAAKNAAKTAATPAAAPKKGKRIISPEAKARMIAGAKKRWAKK